MYNLVINTLFLAKKIIKLKIYFKSYGTLKLLIMYNIIITIALTDYIKIIKYIKI